MGVNLRSLISRFNHETRSALEASAGLCLSRTHYDVEIEHYLTKLLDATDGDFAVILKQFGLDRGRLASDLARSLDKLKTGNSRNPSLSPSLTKMFTEAWTIGSLDFGAVQIRTGHTILALCTNEELSRLVRDISREFTKISAEGLRADFQNIVAASHEREETAAPAGASAGGAEGAPRPGGGKTPNLD